MFSVYEDRNGSWRWREVAPNGQITAGSQEAFDSKSNAERGVRDFKERVISEALGDATAKPRPKEVAAPSAPSSAAGKGVSASTSKTPTRPTNVVPMSKRSTPSDGGLQYERDIKPLAYALAKSDYDALTKIWQRFGVKVGGELKPEQFEEALAAIKEASV